MRFTLYSSLRTARNCTEPCGSLRCLVVNSYHIGLWYKLFWYSHDVILNVERQMAADVWGKREILKARFTTEVVCFVNIDLSFHVDAGCFKLYIYRKGTLNNQHQQRVILRSLDQCWTLLFPLYYAGKFKSLTVPLQLGHTTVIWTN